MSVASGPGPVPSHPLATRVVTACALLVLVLVALFALPPRLFALVVLAALLGAANEWARLARLTGVSRVLFVAGMLLIGGYLLLAPAARFDDGWPPSVVLAVGGVASAFWLVVATPWVLVRWDPKQPLVRVVSGWIVLTGAFVALVSMQVRSPWLVLAAMAIVWIADTAAYFTGRAIGRHRLAPQVSPGKTWEGVAGALAGVAIYALALAPLAPRAGYRGASGPAALVGWVALALALASLSIVGDLYESLLKRQAGVKDSGRLLPGHGGILDRIDALVAAMPPASIAALLFLGRP
ncbi:MAG TPA: phosphatidate cytidylyltransferase [Casimicrobiaceae bacterium]